MDQDDGVGGGRGGGVLGGHRILLTSLLLNCECAPLVILAHSPDGQSSVNPLLGELPRTPYRRSSQNTPSRDYLKNRREGLLDVGLWPSKRRNGASSGAC